jgi:endogenous inhibitor of DNA gyrase (YacG/DUF329 family)
MTEQPIIGVGKPCPVCKKPSTAESRPFCSKRCKDVDLGRWFNGHYAIETDEDVNANDNETPAF